MATYFHMNSSEIQAGDGGAMQTLYLMNPSYDYTTSLPTNTLLLNPVNLSHAPPSNDHQHHPLVGIPLPPAAPSSHDHQGNIHGGGVHYDLWSSIDQNSSQNNQTHMASLAAAASNSSAPLGLLRPVASVPSRQQGLSLSLSSQQVAAYNRPISDNNNNIEVDDLHKGRGLQQRQVTESSPSSVSVVTSSGINSSMQSAILGSKYLKAAQELLDEVVKVESMIIKGTDHHHSAKAAQMKDKMKMNRESIDDDQELNGTGDSTKSSFELTTAQRQELQIKKAKLVNMLDEVEQRYKQYHHQMQVVVSAFEQAAGFGSAKSYTALALRTISKQFRCLKDAISAQLKATSKKLGEDDCLGAKAEGSRLRFVDHQLRQQRALQHLGMQHHAWRPQRGLPERAVTILRAWLFEHFLHPYPKDSDKQQLAKQTGLTRSQVSNWFINARVRLWKPMVEEMYMEELKEQEKNGNGENTSKTESKESPQLLEQIKSLQAKAEKSTIASPTELSNSTISTSPMGGTFQQQTGFNLIGPSDHHLEGFVQRSQKKPRNAEIQNSPSSINDPGGGYGMFSMGPEIGRFNPDHRHHHQLAARTFHGNNGVSLTLGLPHCENLSLSGTQHNLLSSGQNIEPDHFCGIETPQHNSHSSTAYESIDIQNRKRFAAQLLPDFVT